MDYYLAFSFFRLSRPFLLLCAPYFTVLYFTVLHCTALCCAVPIHFLHLVPPLSYDISYLLPVPVPVPYPSLVPVPPPIRACAILQGVYKRSLQGNASAENADLTLSFARETAELGTCGVLCACGVCVAELVFNVNAFMDECVKGCNVSS